MGVIAERSSYESGGVGYDELKCGDSGIEVLIPNKSLFLAPLTSSIPAPLVTFPSQFLLVVAPMKCLLLACLLAILVVASADAAKFPATKLPRGWKKVTAKAGELNPSQQFHITLALRRNNLEKLDKIFWEVSDPQNPKYGNHVNHEEMRSLVSPGPAALSTVTSWLKSNGINNYRVARHEDSISFDASMSQIQQLLKMKFAMYESKMDKRRVAKALGVMVVPDAVAEVIEVIAGHRGFPLPKRISSRHKINKTLRSEETNVTPRTLYESYNMSWFPKTPAGKRNIQAFFQAQGQAVSPSDLSTYCQTFLPEITNCSIAEYIGDNKGAEPGIESSLDSEFIFATGRGTETWVYSYNNMDFCGDLIRWGAAVLSEETFPYVISRTVPKPSPTTVLAPMSIDWLEMCRRWAPWELLSFLLLEITAAVRIAVWVTTTDSSVPRCRPRSHTASPSEQPHSSPVTLDNSRQQRILDLVVVSRSTTRCLLTKPLPSAPSSPPTSRSPHRSPTTQAVAEPPTSLSSVTIASSSAADSDRVFLEPRAPPQPSLVW